MLSANRIRVVLLSLGALALLASTAPAELLQARIGGELWAARDGALLRIGQGAESTVEVELPPGASLYDLEPTATGWVAAGRLPTSVGTDLLILEQREGESDLVPVPLRSEARFRGQPALLVESGRLAGLAWAEGNGHRELEIRAAAWQGQDWGTTELVSPQGPGSQLALDAAVLDDGTWLLVWTAFDGEDDEVVWSRRIENAWTTPRRLHPANQVPDITPAVTTVDDGALVAWSWLDGSDYRMRMARFADGVWQAPRTFGAKGSLFPSLATSESGLLLLYQTIEPPSWTVLELDHGGEARARAEAAEDTNDRPLLFLDEGGRVVLRWPAAGAQKGMERVLEWRELP